MGGQLPSGGWHGGSQVPQTPRTPVAWGQLTPVADWSVGTAVITIMTG